MKNALAIIGILAAMPVIYGLCYFLMSKRSSTPNSIGFPND
jgi:hypothetical protein